MLAAPKYSDEPNTKSATCWWCSCTHGTSFFQPYLASVNCTAPETALAKAANTLQSSRC